MYLNKIEKQKLLREPLGDDALKLAQAIYNTYFEGNKELYLTIKIQTVLKFLKLQPNKGSINYIKNLLEEINEPLLVKNLKYRNNFFTEKLVAFCKYEIKKETIELRISEEFLYVEDNYMLDSFLK